MSKFDECWKEALRLYLEWFLAFFFPRAHHDIDWTRDYETLNVELEKILPESQVGRRYADKLFRVVKKGKARDSRLLHVEVQCQVDEDFERRLHIYNYRTDDGYNQPPVTIALLGDTSPDWWPQEYLFEEWGFVRSLLFPSVKLLDYDGREQELLAHENPFALLVLAHLQSRKTAEDLQARLQWKVRLLRRLRELLFEGEDFRHWVRFIDYLLAVPPEWDQRVRQEILDIPEETRMLPKGGLELIMEAEAEKRVGKRFLEVGLAKGREVGLEEGHAKGLEEGRAQARSGLLAGIEALLELKFGMVDLPLMEALRKQSDIHVLCQVQLAIKNASSSDELRRILP